MIEASYPLLSLVILWPLLGAVAVAMARDAGLSKWLALGASCIELLMTFWVVAQFNAETDANFQLVERHDWIPSLKIELFLGVDGISVLFLPLSALLTLLAILASWTGVQNQLRFYFAMLLILEGITMGVFSALDMMLFFLFWELTLPPIFFLIALWGIGPHRRKASTKYTLFMLFGGVPLLFAIIILALNHAVQSGGVVPEALSFSFPILSETPMPEQLQAVVFVLLLLGFAVKAPLVPFHTWLPTAAMEAPPQMTALLTGLKLGAFGILRFVLPLAPNAAVEYSWALGVMGGVTLIFGAMVALQQSNLRRLLAYLSISHVGLVVMGIASLTVQGYQGAVFQLLNFTLISGSLMLMAGLIHRRLGSTEAIQLGGLAAVMPQLTLFFFLFVLASIGIPGSSGFPAELLVFIGTLHANPNLGIVALMGTILGAAAILDFIRRAFWGPVMRENVRQVQDLRRREFGLLCVPALLILILGFFPDMILRINQPSSEYWLSRLVSSVTVGTESALMASRR
ncbi:MAG: complex I subunit 4 family protein [Gammaproteobacteria bacterium]